MNKARRTLDNLSPEERIEVQQWYVRSWAARRRRRLFAVRRLAAPAKRYDLSGRLVERNGEPCSPHVSTWGEDRPEPPGQQRPR